MSTDLKSSVITVSKRNHLGETVVQYQGEKVAAGPTWVCLRAVFEFEKDLGVVEFRRGDLFTEWFYSDRWYNIFEVNAGTNGRLRGWYCNIARPAVISDHSVYADDLALDVFISPDGRVFILDEDEFADLDLPPDEEKAAFEAVKALRRLAPVLAMPFNRHAPSASQR
jgi:uncharacterized protein